jgi:hypothetical protein
MTGMTLNRLVASGGVVAVLLSYSGECFARQQPTVRELVKAIAKVRSEPTTELRFCAAQQLDDMTKDVDPRILTDAVVRDLGSLLEVSEMSGRAYVASAIENVGARGKPVIPQLQQALSRSECLIGSLTSADAIRSALDQLGIQPPPRPREGGKKCPGSAAEIKRTISETRTGSSVFIREDAAYLLNQLTLSRGDKDLNDETISDLIALLDSHDDGVLVYVVASLQHVGTKASGAVPKLKELLESTNCRLHPTLAERIRGALEQFGASADFRPCS